MSNCVLIDSVRMNGRDVKISLEPNVIGANYFSIIVGKNGSGKSRLLERISAGLLVSSALKYVENDTKTSLGDWFSGILSRREMFKVYDSHSQGLDINEVDFSIFYYFNNVRNKLEYLSSEPWKNFFSYKNQPDFPNLVCVSNSFFHRFFSKEEIKDLVYSFKGGEERLEHFLNGLSDFSGVGYRLQGRGDYEDSSKFIAGSFFSNRETMHKNLDFIERFGFDRNIYISFCINSMVIATVAANPGRRIDKFELGNIDDAVRRNNNPSSEEKEKLLKLFELFLREIKLEELLNREENKRGVFDSLYDTLFFRNNDKGVVEFHLPGSDVFTDGLAEMIITLVKYDLIHVKEVSFSKEGKVFDLRNMSSGEMNTFLMLLRINGEIRDKSVVLIDEPEISLHPSWQRNILPAIEKCFSHFTGCHFIIATHSPQVVSSITEKNSSVIVLGDEEKTFPGFLFKGMSADHLLFSTLDSPGEHNEYATRILTTILAKLNLRKELSVKEVLFLDKAIELYPLNNKDDEYLSIKHLLKQVIALYSA
ncbi:AAA family ATPase [Klebsiella variicola]|uniref:AAA family ATPase n=1 Tax=Klebsiella variicola TaxID=244366 RepID=UPI00224552BA|nr:AAA family ATPase [Klebsiella variicola]MCW9236087.1 ATP-binding protein [Klebsiella variicola]